MSNQQRTEQTSHPFWKLGFWAKARFCFWLSMKIIFRKKDEKAINELLDIHQGSPLNITSLSNPLTHNFGINDDHIFSFACQVGAFKKFTPDYSHFLKDREARRAAARWRFAPRTENGAPVSREAVKTLHFRLQGER